ncbi:hypothetical protein BpHYR1_051046 [Brachionus plicatilis]|uniref:Uncharacterized protein n=1 Tax=Brachionus plicatilis TaxID=10195 RepID=A0A3M7SUM6_BRAPC|nr:hypothetical protein BpHYR1_051046 [Brachionus plicatilis]
MRIAFNFLIGFNSFLLSFFSSIFMLRTKCQELKNGPLCLYPCSIKAVGRAQSGDMSVALDFLSSIRLKRPVY